MKKIKMLTIILLIILVSIISFIGIYVPNLNTMIDVVKEYNFSKELSNSREVILSPSSEQDDLLTQENFNKTKEIVEERLEELRNY